MGENLNLLPLLPSKSPLKDKERAYGVLGESRPNPMHQNISWTQGSPNPKTRYRATRGAFDAHESLSLRCIIFNCE